MFARSEVPGSGKNEAVFCLSFVVILVLSRGHSYAVYFEMVKILLGTAQVV